MHIVIDIGNSKTKIGVFEKESIYPIKTFTYQSLAQTREILSQYNCEHACIVSVAAANENLTQLIQEIISTDQILSIHHSTPLPIFNHYGTPETLGKDRLCAAVAAAAIFENKNCLVIDCGTCIKYDFITQDKKYLGGSISLGLNMRYKALHHFTDRLPLLSYEQRPTHYIGTDTQSSMQTGVVTAIEHEMQGFIHRYQEDHLDLQIILSGGDASKFVNSFKNRIFAVENIVLIGAHQILKYNVS